MKKIRKNVLKSFLFICLGLTVTTAVFAGVRAVINVPSPPGMPIIIDIQKNECTLKYEKPKDDGGSRITGYLIEWNDLSSEKWVNRGATSRLRHTVGNMKEGSRVQFRVSASNKAGMSRPSIPCDPITFRDPF